MSADTPSSGPGGRLPGIRYAGIGDEAATDLPGQLEALRRLDWQAIELRTVDGKAIADLDDHAFARLSDGLGSAGVDVVCVDSRIANWARPITGRFRDDLDELRILARRCATLGTRYVRVMSYPNAELSEAEWGRRAVRRLAALTRRAEDHGLILLHENCSGWAGTRADRMLDLLHRIDSPSLRLLFDIGNGVPYGYDARALLDTVIEHVAHVHVKDARTRADGQVDYTLPGDGESGVRECLTALLHHGYTGTWSIEPHTHLRPHHGHDATDDDGIEAFARYGRSLERLVQREIAPAPVTTADGAYVPETRRAAGTSPARPARLSGADRELFLHLLDTPTAGPLETSDDGSAVRLWEAGRAYAAAAGALGFTVVRHAPADPAALDRDDVPEPVREAAAREPGFLDCQPSLVLRLGPELPRNATVMCNVHLDTVAGRWPARFDGKRFSGRGAIDAKGPAVALLAGVRAARAVEPALGTRVGVLIQAVAGEEGGAMGTFGTRPLVEQGFVGRLNLFCEPTGRRYLPRATASMTAGVHVRGEDAVDDRPEAGHNATVLLGHIAHHLAHALPPRIGDGRVCVAGVHTGDRHNRVYGSGQLLLNISYGSPAAGRAAEAALQESLREALADFTSRAAGTPDLARTAADAAAITSLRWYKRGLPALADRGRTPWAETLLEDHAGLTCWPDDEPSFTCDAIWMDDVPDTYTAVLGPGELGANRAHADGEYADAEELDRYADDIARVLVGFARHTLRDSEDHEENHVLRDPDGFGDDHARSAAARRFDAERTTAP